jgi:hypothetical protein
MIPTRRRLAALVASVGVLAIAASVPVAGAALPAGFPMPGFPLPGATPLGGLNAATYAPVGLAAIGAEALPSGVCRHTSVEGQGATAGTSDQVCVGSGLVYIGPAIGQVATVIGPTIIGPAVVGTSVISAGNVATGP